MNQSRMGSLIEAVFNTVIGWFISFVASFLIYPAFGMHATVASFVGVSMAFTVLSVVRSYVIRRWFNARLQRAAQRLAAVVRHEKPAWHAGAGRNKDEELQARAMNSERVRRRGQRMACACAAAIQLVKSGSPAARCQDCGQHYLNSRYLPVAYEPTGQSNGVD